MKRQQEIELAEHREQLKGDFEKKDEVEGKLRIADVQAMPDEVDDILGYLQNTNFNLQDLDVLIELSKILKQKRLKLFPETSYVFNLQNAGIDDSHINNAME